MKSPIIQRSDLLLQVFFIAFLAAAPRNSRAAINVVSYWRLGESDSGAAAGAAATNTTDSVGAAKWNTGINKWVAENEISDR